MCDAELSLFAHLSAKKQNKKNGKGEVKSDHMKPQMMTAVDASSGNENFRSAAYKYEKRIFPLLLYVKLPPCDHNEAGLKAALSCPGSLNNGICNKRLNTLAGDGRRYV